MLLRNLLKVLIAASSAVLVVRVTTTPETRMRLLGQAEECLLLATGKVSKLPEHIYHSHEIQPLPSYNTQLHSHSPIVSKPPANFKQRLLILCMGVLHPWWYAVEHLKNVAKHSWKFQNYANQISLWRARSGPVLHSRVLKAFSSRSLYTRKTLLQESIIILDFSLLLHYFRWATSLLCSFSRYLFLWRCWWKSTTLLTATSSNAITDETTSTEQVADAHDEDSAQSSASMSASVFIPLSEPPTTQCFSSQMFLTDDIFDTSVPKADKVTAEPSAPQQSLVSNTALEPIIQSIESLIINETTVPLSDAVPPLKRKQTFPNSRLKQQQREAFADLTQFVVRKNRENRTPSFI